MVLLNVTMIVPVPKPPVLYQAQAWSLLASNAWAEPMAVNAGAVVNPGADKVAVSPTPELLVNA
jgi:hypothetical protein